MRYSMKKVSLGWLSDSLLALKSVRSCVLLVIPDGVDE